MGQNLLFLLIAAIVLVLLIVGIFAKNWIFYVLIGCLVFVVSYIWRQKK